MNFFKSLIIITLFSVGGITFADSMPQTGFRAPIYNSMKISPQFPHLQRLPFQTGMVSIDYVRYSIRLDLYGPTVICPEGANCVPNIQPVNAKVELPIVAIQENSGCRKVFVAETKPKGKVGAIIETLVVTDYSLSPCMSIVPAQTEIEYYFSAPGLPVKYGNSFFIADKLLPY